jgi:hypothetical protein
VDCAEIRQGFVTGGTPSGRSVDEHLQRCTHCAELFGDRARLGRCLAAVSARSPDEPMAQLSAIESLLAHEQGLRAFLRSRPTRLRWLLCLALPAALLSRELLRKHVALPELGTSRSLAGLLLLFVLALITHSALRPLPLERSAARLFALFALVAWTAPCVLWFAPEARVGTEELSSGGFALRSLSCFGYGSALAAPSFALLYAFDRNERVPHRVLSLAAGLVAVLASLILLVHCPSSHRAHLIAGHFSIGLVWFVAVSIATGLRIRAH